MITFTFTPDESHPDCTVTAYLHEPYPELHISARRAMIVCPGGAYMNLSEREAEPVALAFAAAGMNVFILRYSLRERAGDGSPLIQAALTIRHIREHAEEYHVDPAYVFISGFSAGGHVAACACSTWKHPLIMSALGGSEPSLARPTAGVLCYPYITRFGYPDDQTEKTVPGLNDGAYAILNDWDADRLVDSETSPAFIWHTFDDRIVPIRNTLLYADALTAAGVPFEYHVYPTGVHGLSLATAETSAGVPFLQNPVAAGWFREALRYCMEFRSEA